jgi:hypothetical protein
MIREYKDQALGSAVHMPSIAGFEPVLAVPVWGASRPRNLAILTRGAGFSRFADPLIQLQRQHGNRHVQRVLALAKQAEVRRQDSGSDGGGGGDLPSPLGQSITCSVDPFKIAAALGGDKSAALEIVNCCESGFGPLPSGCSKSLVDALKKILGKSPGDATRCPPGFNPGKSSSYKGQCCRAGAAAESAQDCCPGERASMMGFCCPEGQVAQGLGCAPALSAPTPSMPPPAPSEPGDYNVPDENSNVAVA